MVEMEVRIPLSFERAQFVDLIEDDYSHGPKR
jgi:hypothetical protein